MTFLNDSTIFGSIAIRLKVMETDLKKSMKAMNLTFKSFLARKSQEIDASFLQLCAVFVFVWFIWLTVICTGLALIYGVLFDKSFTFLTLIAFHFIYIHLDTSPTTGGRPISYLRRHIFWTYVRNYFPQELVYINRRATRSNLSVAGCASGGPYLIGYHPHGMTGMGAITAFSPEYDELSEIFPGVKFSGCTLDSNFRIPILREVLLAMGAVSVSEKSIKAVLSKGVGHAAVIVPGGASEALNSQPGSHDLTLKKRSGFFRIAIECGATVIPVYSFGENDLYQQVSSSSLKSINSRLVRFLGSFFPLYCGGGLVPFNPVPKRIPLITVIGEPIVVSPKANPSKADVERLKELYIKHLEDVFECFAKSYSPNRSLRIVE